MTATLKFNLPEDKYEFDVACKASSTINVLRTLDEELRSKFKYGNEFKSAGEALEYFRSFLKNEINDNELNGLIDS